MSGSVINSLSLLNCIQTTRLYSALQFRMLSTSHALLIKRKHISKWKNKWPNEVYFEADTEDRCFDKILAYGGDNKLNRRRGFKLLLQQLIVKERVVTTVAKGKSLARLFEYLIDEAKKGNEPQVYYMMQSKEYVPRVFEDLLPRYQNLANGYTNIYRLHSDAVYVQYKGRRLHRFNGNSVVELKYNNLPPLLPTHEELFKYTLDYVEDIQKKSEALEKGTQL